MEGPLAGQHLVEDRAEGEDIGAVIDDLTADLLRRHISGGAHYYAGLGLLGLSGADPIWAFVRVRLLLQLGETEVENLDVAFFGDEEVFWFEVAMDDAFVVCGR